MVRGCFASVLVLSLNASCGGPSLRGARAVAPGKEPAGTVATSYLAQDCRDAQGGPVSGPDRSRMFLVKDAEGVVILVEARAGADSLVVHNAFVDGREAVYQAVVRGPDGRSALRDYRVPKDLGPRGRMAVAVDWKEARGPGGSFRATFSSPAVTCVLVAEGGSSSAAASAAAPPSLAPPPAAPAAPAPVAPPRRSTPYGTPEPLAAYAVGHFVAVDRGGGAVARAKVVQALTEKYYVEYDGGGSEWVDAPRVLGRVP